MIKDEKLLPWGYAPTTWVADIWKTYKLTHAGWKVFFERQEGKCAGCGAAFAHPTTKDMSRFGVKSQVDHRHRKINGLEQPCVTEDVRGLLCAPCNRLLGVLNANRVTLQNLVNYLKQHGDY